MAKRSLILTSTSNQGKKLQKTITDINPNAGAVALKGFAQKLNAMTTNTYVQTDCIDKYNVDTEIPPVDTRQTPTITFDASTPAPTTSADFNKTIYLNYNGDGIVYTRIESGCTNIGFYMMGQNAQGRVGLMLKAFEGLSQTSGTYIVGATGTENYKPVEVEITFTV